MKDGTILGCLWMLTFTFSTIMMRHITSGSTLGLFSTFAVISLSMASPILVFRMAKGHWSEAYNEKTSFMDIWSYIGIIYLCAILLSSIAQFIYYEYCDPYLFYDVMADFSNVKFEGDVDGTLSKSFLEQLKAMSETSTADLVLSQASGHMTRDILVTTCMAFIISRNLKNKIEQ